MAPDQDFKSICDLILKLDTCFKQHQYLASNRWFLGILCPHTGCNSACIYMFKDGIRYKCKTCKRNFNAKTGTVMDNTKLPVLKWLIAMWLFMNNKGISSPRLSKDIHVTQTTAWFILQRLRHVCSNIQNPQLTGEIALDETFVGGLNKNRHADKKVKNSQGRSFKDKTPVMGMLQKRIYEETQRPHKVIKDKTVKEKVIITESVLICKVIKNTRGEQLKPVIKQAIIFGSVIVSDEWEGYSGLKALYDHKIVDHGKHEYVRNGFTSNSLEGAWKTLKCSIKSTYHKVSGKHLNKYVSEFEFRYNTRNLTVDKQLTKLIQNINCILRYKTLKAA